MKINLIKKAWVIFILAIIPGIMSAQDEDIQTLFNGKPLVIRGFGGPLMHFTTLDNNFAYMMGGGGGIIINNFLIGGYGVGLANSIQYPDKNDLNTDDELSFGHGGFWLGYLIKPDKLVHGNIQLQLGWGTLNRKSHFGDVVDKIDNIFLITPTVEAEMNVTRFFRIGLGGFYKIATMVDNNVIDANGLSGPGVSVSFKFGWF